jgi:GDPmannose 4,6-dehydratase
MRPAEVDLLVGDAGKAKKILIWEPKVKFEQLIEMMVESDMKLVGDGISRLKKIIT